jgi:hypothetical protein
MIVAIIQDRFFLENGGDIKGASVMKCGQNVAGMKIVAGNNPSAVTIWGAAEEWRDRVQVAPLVMLDRKILRNCGLWEKPLKINSPRP